MARARAFKDAFGDWEALAKQEQLDAIIADAMSGKDPRSSMILRKVTPEEVAEIFRQTGIDISGMAHEITAEELRHAINRHGGADEAAKNPGHRPLTREDLSRIAAVIDAPDEITAQPRGHNRTSIIYGRNFGNGKIEYVERIFETSKNNEPRLTTKSVWVRNATTGVKSSPPRVSTPYRNGNILFPDGRVNPDFVLKMLDANGEPTAEAVERFRRGEPLTGTGVNAAIRGEDLHSHPQTRRAK